MMGISQSIRCNIPDDSNLHLSLILLPTFNFILSFEKTTQVTYQSFFLSPTDAQVNYLKNNFKIYIKIYIKTAPTCFGAITPSSGSALLVLAKVTVVKIAN